ncbi:restriction endonuclease subunit S [Limnohabitans sp. B9-3]|uniref:restriction endonuclease subunit S n=1 Tax=Limnohabitans sp. B9-3 TaxID=1100707 RepID=UPI000C1F2DAD|nr:restriction endonuclease subunit S [Limnohabitans sp. B9-3]PIT75281.1 hypothetical protein B9Z42_07875 [Limnohabitans sp. B9-3]
MGLEIGYKQTEVGVIPDEWEVAQLSELITYTKGFPFKSSEYQSTGIRVLRVSDTTYDSIKAEDAIYVSDRNVSKYANWQLKEHDLIVSTVGSKPPMYDSMVGKVILIDHSHKNMLLNQNAVLLRDRNHREYVQRILLNNLRTKRYFSHIEAIFRGNANQASVTLKELFQFRISLPLDDTEMRAIATALSDVDSLIAGLEKLIVKKRDLKQAIMQQLLTGQTRLPGFSGAWSVRGLGDISEIEMGQSPSSVNYNSKGQGLPLIQGNADIRDRQTIKRVFTTKITKQGKLGDVLLSVRAPVGEVARATFDFCIGRGVCVVRTSNDFIYHALIYLEPSWERISKGSTFDSVNSTDVAAVQIAVPNDFSEQVAIAAALSDIDAELSALEFRFKKTLDLKQGMMQELLTGRTRLV